MKMKQLNMKIRKERIKDQEVQHRLEQNETSFTHWGLMWENKKGDTGRFNKNFKGGVVWKQKNITKKKKKKEEKLLHYVSKWFSELGVKVWDENKKHWSKTESLAVIFHVKHQGHSQYSSLWHLADSVRMRLRADEKTVCCNATIKWDHSDGASLPHQVTLRSYYSGEKFDMDSWKLLYNIIGINTLEFKKKKTWFFMVLNSRVQQWL